MPISLGKHTASHKANERHSHILPWLQQSQGTSCFQAWLWLAHISYRRRAEILRELNSSIHLFFPSSSPRHSLQAVEFDFLGSLSPNLKHRVAMQGVKGKQRGYHVGRPARHEYPKSYPRHSRCFRRTRAITRDSKPAYRREISWWEMEAFLKFCFPVGRTPRACHGKATGVCIFLGVRLTGLTTTVALFKPLRRMSKRNFEFCNLRILDFIVYLPLAKHCFNLALS